MILYWATKERSVQPISPVSPNPAIEKANAVALKAQQAVVGAIARPLEKLLGDGDLGINDIIPEGRLPQRRLPAPKAPEATAPTATAAPAQELQISQDEARKLREEAAEKRIALPQAAAQQVNDQLISAKETNQIEAPKQASQSIDDSSDSELDGEAS